MPSPKREVLAVLKASPAMRTGKLLFVCALRTIQARTKVRVG